MDTLTLAAIALVALLLIGTVAVLLRRRQDSSYGRMPLSFDDPPARGPSIALSGADLAEISSIVAGGNKLEAIKRVRERSGLGLKEAKDYVEALPYAAPANRPASTNRPAPVAQPAVHTDLGAPDMADIAALLASGNKIEAIKRVRERSGLGLKEAKDYVEALPAGGPLPVLPSRSSTPPADAGSMADVHALAQQGRKIEAIKLYRQLTGVGLKEAKDYVDRL